MSELFTIEGFKKSDLCHHGIKGQKWGERRFQNPDGSLTPLGKQRYLGADGKLNKKGMKKLDSEAYDKYEKEQALRIEKARKENFRKRKEANEFLKTAKLNKDDVLGTTEETVRKYKNDPEFKKKADKIADLGLKALAKMNNDNDLINISDEERKGLRDWFIFEDQTMGMASVAAMINNGKSADYVKKLITSIENGDVDVEKSLAPQWSEFMFEVQEGNYEHKLEKFADVCDQVKKS